MCFLWFRGRLSPEVKQLKCQVDVLSIQTRQLTDRVESLEYQTLTGCIIIPEFIDYFGNRTGQKVQVSTMFVTLEGIVISTSDDGVQLREPSGDIVLIPFSKMTYVL